MHWISLPITFFTFLAFSSTTSLNLLHFPSSKSSLANAQSTSSGNMALYRDDLGFYINAYNNPNSSDNSANTPSSNGIPMMLGLYTSKTSLMTNCLNFSSYNCSSKTCDPFQDSQGRQDYLSFKAKGYEASAILYLDYNYWSLYDFALIATSCKSNISAGFGSSRYGIIGMGMQSLAYANYASDVVFAVSISPDLWSGQLNFLNSSTQINRELATQPLLTDLNWCMPHFISIIQMGNFYTSTNFSFLFDLGADTIGLPHTLFEPLMEYFREEVFLDCTHAFIRPQCDYNGLIGDLPNITITLQNSTIVIPPAIYIQNAANITGVVDLVTLNLRALGQDLTGDSYAVTDYMNSLVFDINFMSYYYVVFNLTDVGLIYLYHNQEKQNTKNNNDHALYIIFGCIGLIVLLAVVYCVFKCYQKTKCPQFKGRYSRISQTNMHKALIDKDIQSESSVHHVNEVKVERGE